MRPSFFVVLLLLGACTGKAQQLTTSDGMHVVATVEPSTGLVAIRSYSGDQILTFPQHSFLTVMIGDRIFTNNNVGVNITNDGRYGGFLADGKNEKIADTIRTTWTNKNGCDIIQDVFPVRLTRSGQIVLRWKVKNNSVNTPIWGQAQFLLDAHLGMMQANQDFPILTPYGYRPIWEQYNTASQFGIPSYYVSYEYTLPNPPTFDAGLQGIGYTKDVHTRLGLKPPAMMTVGDWGSPIGTALIDNLWGASNATPWGSEFIDQAVLLQWEGRGVQPGKTVEIASTSYGTGEGGVCVGDLLLAHSFFPSHLHWLGTAFSPDTAGIDLYLWNTQPSVPLAKIRATLEVGPQLRIISPDTGLSVDKKEQQQQAGPAAGFIPQNGVGTAFWKIIAEKKSGCEGSIKSWIKLTVQTAEGTDLDSCVQEILIDCDQPDLVAPAITNIVSSKAYPYRRSFIVSDSRLSDAGLDLIKWFVTPGSNTDSAAFKVEVAPPLSACSKSPRTVTVTQLDSVKAGCFDFYLLDCAGNDTNFTTCIPQHIGDPTPDTLPPQIFVTSKFTSPNAVAPCDGFCYFVNVTENRAFDVGLKSVTAIDPKNMILVMTEVPFGTRSYEFTICAEDSLLDGSVTIRVMDTVGNFTDSLFCYDAKDAGVSSVQSVSEIELIGNPATTRAFLRIRLGESQTVMVRVLDMTGRTLRTLNPGKVEAGSTDIDIVTADLAAGTYYIVAEWSGRQYAKKLQVVK